MTHQQETALPRQREVVFGVLDDGAMLRHASREAHNEPRLSR
jgi:hypothetical protein